MGDLVGLAVHEAGQDLVSDSLIPSSSDRDREKVKAKSNPNLHVVFNLPELLGMGMRTMQQNKGSTESESNMSDAWQTRADTDS